MSKHVKMVDLYNNGIEYEVIVVQYNKYNGDLYYIRTLDLDDIDMGRMRGILNTRNADRMEVWDLFSTITLPNGMNALEYFQQLVLCRTESGEHIRPDARRRGVRVRKAIPKAAPQAAQEDAVPAAAKKGTRAPRPDSE